MRGLDLDLALFVTSALLEAGNTSRGKVKGPPDLSRCSQARPQAFIEGKPPTSICKVVGSSGFGIFLFMLRVS